MEKLPIGYSPQTARRKLDPGQCGTIETVAHRGPGRGADALETGAQVSLGTVYSRLSLRRSSSSNTFKMIAISVLLSERIDYGNGSTRAANGL